MVRPWATRNKRVLGPYNNLLDKSFADNLKVLNDCFLVQTEMDFFRVDVRKWLPARHVRYLQTFPPVSIANTLITSTVNAKAWAKI